MVVPPMVVAVMGTMMVAVMGTMMVAGTAYECREKGNNGNFFHIHSLYHIF